MTQKRNPDIDFGFHATIPRAIRTHYKTLTPMQKWLYVCLKDLCGEHGTCYRTVKVLSAETNISTGMISESIPLLHTAGLIHAEKKKRKEGGKEVWHITIVDIWPANGKLHPTKRSHSEQTTENVHTVNENVHSVNDKGKERSPAEQERSLCETEEGSLSSIITEEVSGEAVGTYGADAPTPAHLIDENDDVETMQFYQNYLRNVELAKERGDPPPPRPQHMLVDALSQKVEKRITNPQIEAISQEMLEQAQAEQNENETQYHIANGSAIGNEERVIAPALSLPSKISSQQAPGTVQAQPLSAPTPAQVAPKASGNVVLPQHAPTAQASGHIPRRPRGGKPAVLELSLLGMDVKRWYEEIRGAKQRMTAGNVAACNALAECDGMSREALKLVIEHDEKTNYTIDLPALAGTGNEKMRFLSFESVWPTVKRKSHGSQQQGPPKEPGTTGFDIYKGNGVEEREQALRDYEEREKNGTLLW